jgi:hypothetical protein
MSTMVVVIGWILTIFLGVLAVVILWKIITNEISLRYLISDEQGFASLSRFQFLLFTFVIAMTLFYLIITDGKFPDIPNQILALLGISGGTFAVAKGIQTSRDVELAKTDHPPKEATPEDR